MKLSQKENLKILSNAPLITIYLIVPELGTHTKSMLLC